MDLTRRDDYCGVRERDSDRERERERGEKARDLFPNCMRHGERKEPRNDGRPAEIAAFTEIKVRTSRKMKPSLTSTISL